MTPVLESAVIFASRDYRQICKKRRVSRSRVDLKLQRLEPWNHHWGWNYRAVLIGSAYRSCFLGKNVGKSLEISDWGKELFLLCGCWARRASLGNIFSPAFLSRAPWRERMATFLHKIARNCILEVSVRKNEWPKEMQKRLAGFQPNESGCRYALSSWIPQRNLDHSRSFL